MQSCRCGAPLCGHRSQESPCHPAAAQMCHVTFLHRDSSTHRVLYPRNVWGARWGEIGGFTPRRKQRGRREEAGNVSECSGHLGPTRARGWFVEGGLTVLESSGDRESPLWQDCLSTAGRQRPAAPPVGHGPTASAPPARCSEKHRHRLQPRFRVVPGTL